MVPQTFLTSLQWTSCFTAQNSFHRSPSIAEKTTAEQVVSSVTLTTCVLPPQAAFHAGAHEGGPLSEKQRRKEYDASAGPQSLLRRTMGVQTAPV